MKHRNSLVCLAVATACASAQARAESAAAANDALAEVVVTAQRRSQNLEEVPIAIEVVSTDTIRKLAGDSIADVDKFVPGLVVSAGSPTQPHYQLRGIGASDFGVGTEPAVGVYLDGVYASRSGASFLAFNDVERVEVLRGPQGTLLGRSSAAGAISIVTRKPTDVSEGSLDLRVGNEGKQRLEAMLNTPLNDSMAVRANFVANSADGFLTDAATGQKLNPEKNWAARIAYRWNIDADTKLLVAWNHDDVSQLARPVISLLAPGATPVPLPPMPVQPVSSFVDPLNTPIYNDVVGNGEKRTLDDLVVTFEHRFGDVSFQSTTDWRQFATYNREDEDATNHIATYFDTANIEHNAAWYQEFRLSGKSKSIDWVAGASYSSEHAQQTSQTDTFTDGVDTVFNNLGIGAIFGPISQQLAAGGLPLTLLGLPWREDMHDDGRFKSLGVFGDVIWHLNDRLNLTTGVRYSHDQKDFTWLAPARISPQLDATLGTLLQYGVLDQASYQQLFFNFVFPEGALQGKPFTSSGSWNDFSPRVVLDYHLTPNTMLYASVAKGFTPGGFDSVSINGKYANETVWNYEAGIKATVPDARLLVNAAVYHYVYRDKQSLVLSSASTSLVPEYNVSTSDQKATGVDLEVHWQPLSALTLGLTGAYINSTYTKYTSLSIGADLAGQPTGEPTWSFAATADYTVPLQDQGSLDFFLGQSYRGATRCNAESQATWSCLPGAPFDLGRAQTLTDAHIGWRSAGGHWGVAVYGTNLFDKRWVTGIDNLTAAIFGTPGATVNDPRRYGLELHASF